MHGSATSSSITTVVTTHEAGILEEWVGAQAAASTSRKDLIKDADLREQSRSFLREFVKGAQTGSFEDAHHAGWLGVRESLVDVARARARQGFTPSETATFVFSLKQPLFARLRTESGGDPVKLADELWAVTTLLDKLGLFVMEHFQRAREEVIARQQDEMLELSTPVVQLWEGILALPLIGTLDSKRTQSVMESLLQRIVDTESEIAIIDITGVPTVDTLTAQHLLKTITATRLMGAECIISGVRPQIAQTIVHLGVNLGDVTTKSTMGAAFALALRKLRLKVVKMADAKSNEG